jgi:erythromycin esterase-like protein
MNWDANLEIENVAKQAQPFSDIDHADLDGIIERCQKTRIVLMGEASHGTREFYLMRSRITQELIRRCGFNIIAIEWDWADLEIVNRYIQGRPFKQKAVFSRFPHWLWANQEFMALIEHLREYNTLSTASQLRANLYGLDLYDLNGSIESVWEYLDAHHPPLADFARHHYGPLNAFRARPAEYGSAVLRNECPRCEGNVVAVLQETLKRSHELARGEEFFDLIRNMNLIVHAERCYRRLSEPTSVHWNLRDRYMFETLESLLAFHGQGAKAIVWAHNNHIGNGAATPMNEMGIFNLGRLCKERYKKEVYSIGFGFDHGTIAAAPSWDHPMQLFNISPARLDSYEHLFHETGISSFFLPLQQPSSAREALLPMRWTRAFGSVYFSKEEDQYGFVRLPDQFDEYIWFDEGHALTPLDKSIDG